MADTKEFSWAWIVEKAIPILETYAGDRITIRQLYYRLVSIGLPNTIQSYKRVVDATSKARWSEDIEFDAFVDRERDTYGLPYDNEKDVSEEIETAKQQIKNWMQSYRLERWANQPRYVEVWIEKKALQGVFERPCMRNDVVLAPCKGYPSLTFLSEAAERFRSRPDKSINLIYFGDYDPSGEDIPRSIEENLNRLGVEVNITKVSLTPEQIAKYNLPGVPAKQTDSRTAAWSGEDVVELDAMDPKDLVNLCETEIKSYFDRDLYAELKDRETRERKVYQAALKDFVNDLDTDNLDG